MTRQTIIRWARAAILLALSFAVLGATAAWAADPFETELAAAAGGVVPDELSTRIERLRARGVPVTPLEKKLREGVAKKVPPSQLVAVLGQMADDLLWLRESLGACRADRRVAAPLVVLEFGCDVLMSGIGRSEVAPLLEILCRSADPRAVASEAAEVYFYLIHRMGAPRLPAWALTRELARRGESKAALSSLVAVLQDIRGARGSVDRALEVATRRMEAGASLRAIKNELQEQFLRP